MDGISGIVIGSVFKVEKEKLPKGYQADDIAFVVMGEGQKVTSGQDWVTELSGQLMLLDLGEEEREKQLKKFTFNAEPLEYGNVTTKIDNTRVVNPVVVEVIEDEFTTSEDVNNDISEFFPNATVTDGDASLGNENEEEKPNEQDKIEALRGNGTKYVGVGNSREQQVAKGKAGMDAKRKLLQTAGVSNNASVTLSGFVQVDSQTVINRRVPSTNTPASYTVTVTYELRQAVKLG